MTEVNWRTVTEGEYYASSNRNAPHRIAFGTDIDTVYELGTEPVKVPTGEYALVVPSPEVVRSDYYYFIGIDEEWYQVDPDDPYDVSRVPASEVEGALNGVINTTDSGKPTHIIAFDGVKPA